MRRSNWVILAAALGFLVGWGVAFSIYITVNSKPGCDGPCLHDR